MNLSEPFVRRPVATTLVSVAIVAFGAFAYGTLPVSDLPTVDFPVLLVTASQPGASPDTMASSVATPLERQFSTIAGLQAMTSTNAIGSTQIVLQFSLDRELDAAALDVQSAITTAGPKLPPNLPSPPTYQKVNPADQPIMFLALTSADLPPYALDEYAETRLAQRLSTISGVAQVLVYGAQKYAVRIQLDPRALSSRGIGLDDVTRAVEQANVNLPTGTLWGSSRAFTVEANGQLTSASGYRPIIVASRNGAPARLGDLGQVVDGVENDKLGAWYVNQRAVVLAVQRQPGTNTVAVAHRVSAVLPSFLHELPASVSLHLLYDRSAPIEDSVHDVELTLLFTLFLVVIVIFLFLRTVRATVIPSIALPMSIVGTFAVMSLLGYSLDNLSLMALTLSLGFVVDDAIVMLENIVRHIERGEKPFEAALAGAREIGFTIVSMTVSLAAVFIPVLFMGGIVGRLFREFSVTIAVAILISGFVSLTLTPMLCSRFLRGAAEARPSRFERASEAAFGRAARGYDRSLTWVLDHRPLTMAFSAVILLLTVYLFGAVPKGFLPSDDTSQIFAQTEAEQGISYEGMVEHQQQAAAIIAADENVLDLFSAVGSRPGTPTNNGLIFVHLKPRKDRPLAVDDVIAELRPKLAQIPGFRVYPQNPPPIRIGGQLTKGQYQYTLQATDTAVLYPAATRLEARMHALAGLTDVSSDLQLKNPQVEVRVDRDLASTAGVSLQQVEDALYTAYGARQVSTIYAPNNDYQVIVELAPPFQRDPSALELVYVHATTGALVPLSAVARFERTVGPLTVNHAGQLPSVTLSFNLAPGVALGPAVADVERVAREEVPPSVLTSFQGTAQAFASSAQGLGALLLLAIVVIYLVLGVLYESYVHPLTILSALPFAGFGALATLMLFHTELSLYAFVGLIMLVGLVKKNGIMMVDFAVEARRAGKSARDAIHEASLVRFRPIMMTTLAALAGALPIALGIGAGALSRRPLGLAVVGGLLFSQALTLFVTPVFYTYMEGASERVAAWRERRAKARRRALPPWPPSAA